MKILGKSRGVAAVIAAAIGLAELTLAGPASAQIAPTGLNPTQPVPPKPAQPTAPAQPAPKPAAPAGGAAGAGTAAPKPADTKPGDAKPADPKALLASGDKKLKAGDHAGALADYEASNAAKASPEADRGIAVCQDKLGKLPEALVAYERFLANVPAKMKTEGDEAKKRADEIKAMPGKVHVEANAQKATYVLDGKADPNAPEGKPLPADLELPAGKHSLKVQAEGYETTDKELDVQAASKQDVKLELVKKSEPVPPPPPPVVAEAPTQAAPPPPPPPEPRSKVPAFVTGAVAIVAAGVGTGFGISALSKSSDFKDNPTTKTADDGENNALVADMMFGIAITFGVTSAVLFLSSDAPQTAKAAPKARPAVAQKKITVTPTPYVTPSGGGAGALVRF